MSDQRAVGDPATVRHDIEQAFHCAATRDAETISVVLRGDTLTLRGRVRCWHDREIAEDIAGRVPGVMRVCNEIDVVHV